jgi:hypothetical protein
MTFDDPGDDIFGHLDDPAPRALGDAALSGVMRRGQQIRRRRYSAYALGATCLVVAAAGAAVAVTGSGPLGGKNSIVTPATSTNSASSKHPSGKGSGHPAPGGVGISSSSNGGALRHHRHHHHHHPSGPGGGTTTPLCVTPTPTSVATPTGSATPTPTIGPVVSTTPSPPVCPSSSPPSSPSSSPSGSTSDVVDSPS